MKDNRRQLVRIYASVVRDDQRQYEEIPAVLGDEDLAEQFLNALRRDLESVIRRYEIYEWCSISIRLVRQAIEALDLEEKKSAAG